jgi:hypothetical protein
MDNLKVIKSASNALKNNGYFLLDFLNKKYLIENLVPLSRKKTKNKTVIQIRRINKNFAEKDILIFKKKPYTSQSGRQHFREKIKLYSLADFRRMFATHRLKIIKTFGSYAGTPFNMKNSERLIILAKKR